ncbi:unnamed protein product [Paramecium sonneborni]|uniref:Uncharacterized protein n=1 Tax=Paramecium sonneborni TaxID=65129 RepID=A0A8S1KI80_9CILI|nr:unnamed protein product [Paramecium sonneborni]
MSTIQPKYATYQIDGTGRDMYISFNNGGTLKTIPNYSQQKYHSVTPQRRNVRSISHNTKMIHYHNNGTGRDLYISQDSDISNTSFLRGLRNYQRTYQTPKKFRIRINKYI